MVQRAKPPSLLRAYMYTEGGGEWKPLPQKISKKFNFLLNNFFNFFRFFFFTSPSWRSDSAHVWTYKHAHRGEGDIPITIGLLTPIPLQNLGELKSFYLISDWIFRNPPYRLNIATMHMYAEELPTVAEAVSLVAYMGTFVSPGGGGGG